MKPKQTDDPRLPDLADMFRVWCANGWRRSDGWGTERLHVSDLPQCPALVHARRRGEPMLPYTAESVMAIEAGNAWERLFLRFMEDWPGEPVRVDYQAQVGLYVDGDTLVAAPKKTPFPWEPTIVTGTADFVLTWERAVVDAPEDPSAEFAIRDRFCLVADTKWVMDNATPTKAKDPTSDRTITEPPHFKDKPRYEHLVQAAAYALAFDADYFGIVRGGAALDVHWERTEPWRAQITALVRQQRALTDPNAPAPDAVPPTWQWNDDHTVALACYRCDHGGCERNKDPRLDREEILTDAFS